MLTGRAQHISFFFAILESCVPKCGADATARDLPACAVRQTTRLQSRTRGADAVFFTPRRPPRC